MNASIEFLESFVASLDAVEFGTLKFAVNERADREEKAFNDKIAGLKVGFEWTPVEERLLSQRANIEVIKSLRHRFNLGLREAKHLFDAMRPTVAEVHE